MSHRSPRTRSDSGSCQKVSNGQQSHKSIPFLCLTTLLLWLCLLVWNVAVTHHASSNFCAFVHMVSLFGGHLHWEAFLDFSHPFSVVPQCHIYAFLLQWSLSAPLDSELLQAHDGTFCLPMARESSNGLWMERDLRWLPRAIGKWTSGPIRACSHVASPLHLVIFQCWFNKD